MSNSRNLPTEDDVLAYFDTLSNWGRWGSDDDRGTLNFITADTIRQAIGLVKIGRHISCGRAISPRSTAADSHPALHFMMSTGESAPAKGFGGSTDWFGMAFHGHSITHVDAHSHIFWNAKLYNGRPARTVTAQGAKNGSVEAAADGIVARAVLVDIPRFRGVDRLIGPEPIVAEELEACLAQQRSIIRPGDALVFRTGRDVTGPTKAPAVEGTPGLQANCLPWLHRNRISLLMADVAQDVQPSGYHSLIYPLHAIGIVAMGLWLLDNAWLEDVAQACAASQTWEFLLLVAPLRLKNGTGSPVNPIAVF